MAKFKFNGVDGIEACFEQLARLTDDDKRKILEPAAELIRDKHSAAIRSRYTKTSNRGILADSISVSWKTGENGPIARIAPKGKHPGTGTGKRMKKTGKGRRSSGKYSGSNAEVLYYLEYGTPRIPASHLIGKVNEDAEPEVAEAVAAGWDEHLKNKGF